MKVLVIDDTNAVCEALTQILLAGGYDVISAVDGLEGLAAVRAHRPDLVISDVVLPGMDGFQLLSAIRRDADLADLPVIFFTGKYLDDEDKELAERYGVSRYLMKPLDASRILEAVNDSLTNRRDARQRDEARVRDEPLFLKEYNERLISKLKRAMMENDQMRMFLEHIMDGIGDGIMVIDRQYRVLTVNTAAANSVGMKRQEIIGRYCYEMTHRRREPCKGLDHVCPMSLIFDRGEKVAKLLHTHASPQGEEQQIEITASPVLNEEGTVFAMVETFRNLMDKNSDDELVKLVKRLNEAQTHLKHMTITDDLTGLRNRRYIVERLEEEFERAKRSGMPLSLIMLDIDRFKLINDNHGHLFGDIVLRVVAARIKMSLRRHDIVGRVGGEEFLVICPESSVQDATLVAERIRHVICQEPIGDGVVSVYAALSGGVTMMRPDDENAEKLFSRADEALYLAKDAGRNRVMAL